MRFAVSLAVFCLASSCGSSSSGGGGGSNNSNACASSVLVGSWLGSVGTNADTMTFNADCTGTGSYCASTFTYPNVTNASGGVLVAIKTTNGASGCGPAGQYSCQYVVTDGTKLQFTCGGSVATYQKAG